MVLRHSFSSSVSLSSLALESTVGWMHTHTHTHTHTRRHRHSTYTRIFRQSACKHEHVYISTCKQTHARIDIISIITKCNTTIMIIIYVHTCTNTTHAYIHTKTPTQTRTLPSQDHNAHRNLYDHWTPKRTLLRCLCYLQVIAALRCLMHVEGLCSQCQCWHLEMSNCVFVYVRACVCVNRERERETERDREIVICKIDIIIVWCGLRVCNCVYVCDCTCVCDFIAGTCVYVCVYVCVCVWHTHTCAPW